MKKLIKVEVEFEAHPDVDFKARILSKIKEIPFDYFHGPDRGYEHIGIIRKLSVKEVNV